METEVLNNLERCKLISPVLTCLAILCSGQEVLSQETIVIGDGLELFVDDYLIDSLENLELRLHHPQRAPRAKNPPPRQGVYSTIVFDGTKYHLYYRDVVDGEGEYNERCAYYYLTSSDGIEWETPNLGLFTEMGEEHRNMILAPDHPISHNFTPFLDQRPGTPEKEKFKAIAGGGQSWSPGKGLHAFVSGDGVHWNRLQDEPVIPEGNDTHESEHYFDSQNVAFWSAAEECYVCYYRTWFPKIEGEKGIRTISRATSKDFVNWTSGIQCQLNHPGEQFYTSAIGPYFRAPHIYIALPLRFQPWAGGDIHRYPSDTILLTARGGDGLRRPFEEAFIRPGRNQQNWKWPNPASMSATVNVIPTGTDEMSIYVRDARYVLRLDGFASVHANGEMGEMVTKPLVFDGANINLNYSTSAAGRVLLQIEDESGNPLPGFSFEDCPIIVGDRIDYAVQWKSKRTLEEFAGKPVRLRLRLSDADLYSLQFR